MLRVSVTEAEGQIAELVRRAEAGDEVVLTRRGRAVARLAPVAAGPDRTARRALIESIRLSAAEKARAGSGAADAADFLYGDDGLSA